MSHPDTCWRVAAIYRACYRWGKGEQWAFEKLTELTRRSIRNPKNLDSLSDIWFRAGDRSHMMQRRKEYLQQINY